MNFYNNFLKSWSDKFPNIAEPDDLKCLKADEFFSVNDQRAAMEKLITVVSTQMFELKSRQEQLLYFNDFLKSSVTKLNTIAQMFDGKSTSVSNGHSDETNSNNTFLSNSSTLTGNNLDSNNSNMFLTSFDSGSTDLNWKPFAFSSLPINQNDRLSNNFTFLNGDIKYDFRSKTDRRRLTRAITLFRLETQLPEISHFSSTFMTPTMKSDSDSSKPNSHSNNLNNNNNNLLLNSNSLNNNNNNNSLSSALGSFESQTDASRRPFKCNQCERAFAQKSGLEAHLKLHTGERPYECHICGRAFKLKAQLQTHERVHSGERPFGCKICGKLFRQQCHVVQHLRSHTDEKPHQCEKCGKGFRQKHSLLSHEKRQCQTRQSRRMLPAGTTMWIGLSDVPGGSLTKELRPSSDNPALLMGGTGNSGGGGNGGGNGGSVGGNGGGNGNGGGGGGGGGIGNAPSSQANDSAWSQSCSTGADDSSSVDTTHDE